MKTYNTSTLWAIGIAALINTGLWILALCVLAFLFAGCDVPDVLEQIPTRGVTPDTECGQDLFDDVEARAVLLECHSECSTLQLECMGAPHPACHSCEHEAAICSSTCPEPVL